jgi:hypothetical protein
MPSNHTLAIDRGTRARSFLATFRPIVHTSSGRTAAVHFALPPFIDRSCRREPDLQSPFPSITATCRAGSFAPRLRVGDRIAYLTAKGRYLGETSAGWRVVAVLHVIERLLSHPDAAAWYRARDLPLPSNCLVDGNPPKPLEQTNGKPPAIVRTRMKAGLSSEEAIRTRVSRKAVLTC